MFGQLVGYNPAPRRYQLSYLASAWAPTPAESQRLLDWVSGCLRIDEPAAVQAFGSFASGGPITLHVRPAAEGPRSKWLTGLPSDRPLLDVIVSVVVGFRAVTQVLEPERRAPKLPVGVTWTVQADCTGRGPMVEGAAREAVDKVLGRLGVNPEAVDVTVTRVVKDEVPGLHLCATGHFGTSAHGKR